MVVPILSCVHLFIQTFNRLQVGVYHMLGMLSVSTANKQNERRQNPLDPRLNVMKVCSALTHSRVLRGRPGVPPA